MENRKIFDTMDLVNDMRNGFKSFIKYMEQKGVDINGPCCLLFIFLAENWGNKKNITEEMVFKAVFGDDPFDQNRLKEQFKALTARLNAFIVHFLVDEDKYLYDWLTIRRMKLGGRDHKIGKAIIKYLTKYVGDKTVEALILCLRMLNEIHNYYPFKDMRKNVTFIKDMMDKVLILFYFFYLKGSALMLQGRQAYGIKLPEGFEAQLKSFMALAPPDMHLSVTIYHQIVEFWMNPGEILFKKLLKQITSQLDDIPADKAFLFRLLLNCLEMAKLEEKEQKRIQLKLYKLGDKKDLLAVDGNLDSVLFLSIVLVGCMESESKWASDFIKGNIDKIASNKRETERLKKLSMALVDFYEGRHQAVTIKLRKIKFNEFSKDKIRICLIMMALYKNDNNYTLKGLKERKKELEDLMKEGLKNNEITEYRQQKYLNFAALLWNMANHQSKKMALAEFNSYGSQLTKIHWLKEMILELN